jgi:hypothetical protein
VTWVISNLVSAHLEMVLVFVQDGCTACAKRIIGSEIFWTHPIVLLGDKAQLKARFGPFEDSQILIQDRCTVCAERTIGSVLDTPDETPRRRGSCEISFQSVWRRC